MLNPEQIGRIADAVAAIRTDWPVSQVADYLEANHAHRAFPALAAAAVYAAADPGAHNLALLEIEGHWWIASPAVKSGEPVEPKLGPKRDANWWSLFEYAKAQRSMAFGYPKPDTTPDVTE